MLTNTVLHHNVDYTPYEGMTLNAWPHMVLSRGDVIAKDGECQARPGRGRFHRSSAQLPVRLEHRKVA